MLPKYCEDLTLKKQILGKGENVGTKHFLLFPKRFQMDFWGFPRDRSKAPFFGKG